MELACRSRVSLASCGKGARKRQRTLLGKAGDVELVLRWCYTPLLRLCSCFQLSDAESLNLGGLLAAISLIGAEHFSLN
jgi:hypothetical protein